METASWVGWSAFLPPPELAEAGAEIAEGHGEVGEEGPFVLRDELPQFSDADLAAVRAVTPGVDPEVVVFSRWRSRSELREIVVNEAACHRGRALHRVEVSRAAVMPEVIDKPLMGKPVDRATAESCPR